MRNRNVSFLLALLCLTGAAPPSDVHGDVDAIVAALMRKDHIPGMAVAITYQGRVAVYNYGLASRSSRTPVNDDTLFEIGSVTKTFTATLAAWAVAQHRLSLSDPTARYIPALRGAPFGNVALLNLGTHTAGGLPLQFPQDVTDDASLMQYFKRWRPGYPIGGYRTYGNPGIGMVGLITARAMGADFTAIAQQQLFPALGLRHTFIEIPPSERAWYAWGYSDAGKPIRQTRGVLWQETYGVRTTASDLLRFISENIDPSGLPATLRDAVVATHTRYFHAGPLTQDLIWEEYAYPVSLQTLLAGNSTKMLLEPSRSSAIEPPQPPTEDAWLNKTGTTNGFGAYVAFVPAKRVGIVLLANTPYPIRDRVTAAYRILHLLL